MYRTASHPDLIDLEEDGSFGLGMKYFNHGQGLKMTDIPYCRTDRELV